jgi:hypothetical protein
VSAFINDCTLESVLHMQEVDDLLIIIKHSPIGDVVWDRWPEQTIQSKMH